jgi:hypothetical protein
METAAALLAGFIVLGVLIVLYFIPALVAKNRNHHNALAIFILNFFLGWTLFGWVVALIWAMARAPELTITPTARITPTAERRLPCPYCAEAIIPAARVCRFCGHELGENWARPAAPTRGSKPASITSWTMPEQRHRIGL